MIEHRWNPRFQIAIPVALNFKNGAYGHGVALDISAGGLFVKTAVRSWHGSCVDVRITVMQADQSYPVRLPSLVVHRNRNGIGVMFLELDEQADRFVAELLRANAALAPARTPDPRQNPEGLFLTQDSRGDHPSQLDSGSSNRRGP